MRGTQREGESERGCDDRDDDVKSARDAAQPRFFEFASLLLCKYTYMQDESVGSLARVLCVYEASVRERMNNEAISRR